MEQDGKTEMSEELKPCPFCGASARVELRQDDNYNYTVQVICNGCGCQTSIFFGDYSSRQLSIEAWNRRAK